jgi:hypothetical protein
VTNCSLIELIYTEEEAAQAQLVRQDSKSRAILPCETVQVFIQMYALERGRDIPRILSAAQQNIPTRHLIITIRYADWWWWERNEPLRISSHWIRTITFPDSLEKLTVELETRQGKKHELDSLVSQDVSHWQFSTESGKRLTLGPRSPQTMSYIGTDSPGGEYRHHHKAAENHLPGAVAPAAGEMYYYVATMNYLPPA